MSVRLTPLVDPEQSALSHRLAWLASDADGVPVGSAFVRLFLGPNQRHLSELDLQVHPSARRRGTGTLLLHAAADAARADGRRSLVTEVDEGSPGAEFLSARGFAAVLTTTYTRLALADVDVPALAAAVTTPHPGYELVSWDGTVPDGWAEEFARSHRAMDDMPMGDMDHGHVDWDVDRVRSAAEAVARRGELLYTVAVVDTADGSMVGYSELVVPGDGTGDGQHYGTGVLPEHRGHGLAYWMKAATIVRVRDRYPDLAGLCTDTADDNAPMRAVNDRLGYAPTHRTVRYQLDLG